MFENCAKDILFYEFILKLRVLFESEIPNNRSLYG